MTFFSKRRARTTVIAGLAGIALTCSALPATAVTPDLADLKNHPRIDVSKVHVDPSLMNAHGTQTVFVQFKGEGAIDQAKAAGNSKGVADEARAEIAQKAESVTADVKASDGGAVKVFETKNSIPGAVIKADAEALLKLQARDDVVAITPIKTVDRPEPLDNGSTDIDTRALATWQSTRVTGKGVKIAVIDSGIDYTHADFGGPGTAEAYTQAGAPGNQKTMPAGLFDPKKVLPGIDLAGDDYNAKPGDGYQPIPHPDGNPLDCITGGHGSHVAGTAAGYGENEDGTTFRAGENGAKQYADLVDSDLLAMRIGPGSAPEAQIMPVRVFGCEGSTDLTLQALDYVMDPDGNPATHDQPDIMNLSLGSDLGPYESPETLVMNKMAENGILPVIAAGNAGDATDIAGTPGGADAALTVANSVGSRIGLDGIKVNKPTPLEEKGQYASSSARVAAPVTGDVVMGPTGANSTGCDAFAAADAARVKGKIVWLHWADDETKLPCGSAKRFDNAQKAGAIGVLLDSPVDVFSAGIAGNAAENYTNPIPGFQFRKTESAKYQPLAADGTLNVTFDNSLRATASGASNALDTLNTSSSRGYHGSHGVIKPEVAAPGTSINSVGVGQGSGGATMSGTSMATPHVAGIAALVREADKGLSASEIKAVVTNTATHKVVDANGNEYGPTRVGSGRVDAKQAVDAKVIAYNAENPALVSVSFGVIEAGADVYTATKKITLKNFGADSQTFNASYVAQTEVPGVTYTLSPASVTVAAGATASVDVTVTVDPTKLDRVLDKTMAPEQAMGTAGEFARNFVTSAEGRVHFKSATTELYVPLQSAPKPTSDVKVNGGSDVRLAAGQNDVKVPITGRTLDQGSYNGLGIHGLGAAFELVAESPKRIDEANEKNTKDPYIKSAADEVDLNLVGISSDIPALKAKGGADLNDAMVNFAISTYGNRAVPTWAQSLEVLISTTGDANPEFVSYATQFTKTDLSMVMTYKLENGAAGQLVDINFLNGTTAVDTNPYDNNVWLYSAHVDKLGLDPAAASLPITFQVNAFNAFYTAVDAQGQQVAYDTTGPISYDLAKPSFWAADSEGDPASLYLDGGEGSDLTLHRAEGASTVKALFVHLHNRTGDLTVNGGGDRTQVLRIGDVPTLATDKAEYQQGEQIVLRAEHFTAGAEVAFVMHSDPVTLGTATADASGVATITATIPADAELRVHDFVATAGADEATAQANVVAAADATAIPVPTGTDQPTPGLPGTGAEGTTLTLLGALALLLAGGAALTLRRRGADE